MTANQINYAKHLEDVRTHKANEEIGKRQAAAAESQAETAATNAETQRLNTEINALNAATNQSAVGAQWYGAQANAAYQQAMATVSQYQAEEAKRHNTANEANDLLRIKRDYSAKTYATKKQYEQSIYSTDTGFKETELQTRTQLITGLINAVPKVAELGLKLLLGTGG